jgi:hypothetical protein
LQDRGSGRATTMVGGTILIVIILTRATTIGEALKQCKGNNYC